jgi:hypothetical protein
MLAQERLPMQCPRCRHDNRDGARFCGECGVTLEKLHADRLGEHAALIAHHWEASGMRSEAARWKRRAALRVANIKVSRQGRRRPP